MALVCIFFIIMAKKRKKKEMKEREKKKVMHGSDNSYAMKSYLARDLTPGDYQMDGN